MAQLTGQLYGLDGAAFDPAGAFRQTTLPEYRVTAERLGIDVSQNQIPDSFRNYHVEGSMVPDGTGAHLGTVREIPPFATVGIGDVLQGALVGWMSSQPVLSVLAIGLIDQFGHRHPMENLATAMDALARLEADPILNADGSEVRFFLTDDGYVLRNGQGELLGRAAYQDGQLHLTDVTQEVGLVAGPQGVHRWAGAIGAGFQTLAQGVERHGPALIDALSVLRAIQSGEPLPLAASGLRLANDLSNLQGVAHVNLSGAAHVASGMLSLMNLHEALAQGDGLAAVTAGAHAVHFGASAYANFVGHSGDEALRNAIAAGEFGQAGAAVGMVSEALPYLNLVNSIAKGDEVGVAVSLVSFSVPAVGMAYAVYRMIDSLFGDDVPDPWGTGRFTWDASGALVIEAAGEMGGDQAVTHAMEGVRATLEALIERERQLNPGSALGLIPQRIPAMGYDMSGYRYTDIDPLTGQEAHPRLRFDVNGRPYNAEPGSPQAHRSMIESAAYSALARGAIAPLWEVRTAQLQAEAGDPRAGLTPQERAARDGQLAAAPTGPTQTWRPVMLDLDGDGLETIPRAESAVSFDVDDAGYLKHTGWLAADDGFLTLDRNYNGQTDSGKEMFSNGAVSLGLRGLAGMAWVDANHDGRLTAADPVWSELRVWRDTNGNGVQEAHEVQSLEALRITALEYTMGSFVQGGVRRQLASPDLEADTQGARVSLVPEGILMQSSGDGHLSLLVTRVDDRTPVQANRDGLTGYEDTELIVASADLLANDRLGGFGGRDLSITGLARLRHGTGYIDANGFIHFQPAANYAGGDAGFDYIVRAGNGQEGAATVDITVQGVNDAPTLGQVEHVTRPVYGYTPVRYYVDDASYYTYTGGGEPIYEPYAIELVSDGSHDGGTTRYVYHPPPGNPWMTYHTTPIAYEDTGAGRVRGVDVDHASGELTYEVVAQPQYGAVTINPDGAFQYTGWKEPGVPSDRLVEYGQYVALRGDTLFRGSHPASGMIDPGVDVFQVRITDPAGASTVHSIEVPHYGPYFAPLPPGGGGKPIAVDLDGDGFEFVDVDDSQVFFDLNGDGWRRRTAWVGADDGLLAYDRDGDGRIAHRDDISFVGYLEGAQTDLQGLAAFDTNGDGRLDAGDEAWARFGIWQDANQDGVSDPGEWRTLDAMGVRAVGLRSDGRFQVIGGQSVHGVAALEMADGSQRAIADVTLAYRNEVRVRQADGAVGTIAPAPFPRGGEAIEGGQEQDLVLGKTGDDIINTHGGDDLIFEGGGNDIIDAGAGHDLVYAGGDNDLVMAGDGDDVVYAGLGDDLVFGGDGHDALFAEGGNDVVFGGAGNDLIAGGPGNDVLSGDQGHDQIYGEAGRDALFGGEGDDELAGMDDDDRLDGGPGRDLLDGGRGADEMIGGPGDDTYAVDNPGDVVVEHAGEGVDSVQASIDYVLGPHVEHLRLVGDQDLWGTGNALDNHLIGNGGHNRLDGGAGHDVLDGGRGADEMIGGPGDDTYRVDDPGDVVVEYAGEGVDSVQASIDYVLGPHVEHLRLVGDQDLRGAGNALANHLIGNGGHNLLDGGAGADFMAGAGGDDTYVVDDPLDTVFERAGEGVDTVHSHIHYVLPAHVENVVLLGEQALAATGNDLDNRLEGNAGDNLLVGGGGHDVLRGGAGHDTLAGGEGDDLYRFDAGDGLDRIEDTGGRDTVRFGPGIGAGQVALRVTQAGGIHTAHLRVLDAQGSEQPGQGFDFEVQRDHRGGLVSPIERFEFADGGIKTFDDLLTKTRMTLAGPWRRNITTGRDDDVIVALLGNHAIHSGAGNDIVYAGVGRDTLDGGGGDDILLGGAGSDLLRDLSGHNIVLGGSGDDVIEAGLGNDFIAGGRHDDTIDAGAGANLIAFNRGDGRDTLRASADATHTLSLGGGIQASALSLRRQGPHLVLEAGGGDRITFEDWYAEPAGRQVATLQIIEAQAPAPHGRGPTVQVYDFQALVARFDAAQARQAQPSPWSLMHGLLDAHLATHDGLALGGELALGYAQGNDLLLAAQSVRHTLRDADFGHQAQGVGRQLDQAVQVFSLT